MQSLPIRQEELLVHAGAKRTRAAPDSRAPLLTFAKPASDHPIMSQGARLWHHVIINAHATWLHGDPRGFRTREHRIHSSGDYRHPPPAGEHGQLHEYHKDRSRREVHIGRSERAIIRREIVRHLQTQGFRMLAIAVTNVHAHLLVELPGVLDEVKAIIGSAKRYSSPAVEQRMPGSVWAARGNV